MSPETERGFMKTFHDLTSPMSELPTEVIAGEYDHDTQVWRGGESEIWGYTYITSTGYSTSTTYSTGSGRWVFTDSGGTDFVYNDQISD
jgi:hypothetical protein